MFPGFTISHGWDGFYVLLTAFLDEDHGHPHGPSGDLEGTNYCVAAPYTRCWSAGSSHSHVVAGIVNCGVVA